MGEVFSAEMSKAEAPVDDAKKLAQRCKALEAQLRQTITKKEHHEIVLEFEDKITGMEKTVSSQDRKIAEQEKELARTRAEMQKNAALGKQIADVGAQISALGKTVESQGRAVEALLFKVSQGTVPASAYQQSTSKVRGLEEKISEMVGKGEHASLQRRYEEATKQLQGMVPASDHEALKGRVQELEAAMSSMVLRDQLESSEATVRELRAKLSERVPQSTYDELVSKVVQLAEEVTGGQPQIEAQEPAEPTGPEPMPAVPEPVVLPEVPATPVPGQEVNVETAPAEPSPPPLKQEAEPPEIREVGTKLAELKTGTIVEAKPADTAPTEAATIPSTPTAKAKSELTFVVVAEPAEADGQDPQD